MNLSNIFPGLPQEFWAGVVELGNRGEWLSTLRMDGDQPRTAYITDKPKVRGLGKVTDLILDDYNGIFRMWVDTLAKASAAGIKMFRPSFEQCESMEHVKLTIPIADYQQPYPCMFLEYPEEYRRSLSLRSEREAPRHIVLQHRQETNFVFTGCSMGFRSARKNPGYQDELFYTFQDRPCFPTIEDALMSVGEVSDDVSEEEDRKRAVINESITRVALNLCLMLCQHPTRTVPSNPKMLRRAVEGPQEGNIGEANRFEKRTHVHVVRLEQDIIVRENRTTAAGPGEPSGRMISPHWRKGHWRRQHYGAGNQQVKQLFIRPVFVRQDAFTGNLAQTSVIYRDPSQNKI
jgi:hypothetical protein